MTKSKRNYALVGLLILAVVVPLSSSLKFGTRAIVDEKSSEEPRAGNNNLNNKKSTAEDVAKRNVILRNYMNREFLYPSIDKEVEDEEKSDSSLKLDARALEFGSSNDDHKQLKRQQRTNANENLFNEDIEKMAYELYKLSRYQQEDQSKKNDDTIPYESNYDYLMNELNSEDGMKNDEIKGSIIPDENNLPEINDEDMNEFYKELFLASSRFGSDNSNSDSDSDEFLNSFENSMSDESQSNEENRVIKPKIHYKETYLSADIYNKMLNNGPLKSNEPFSNIQPSSVPSNAQNNKYLYNPLKENDKQELNKLNKSNRDFIFVSLIAGCTIAALLAAVAGGVCFYTVKRGNKQQAFDTKNGIFSTVSGVPKSGSIKSTSSSSSGDRRLAQSAQMFHYQHQKQQMIAMEKANNDTKQDQSDNSEGETEEGDYTVYECPGLAPTGEMEVKNPLFKEEFPSSTNIAASNSITSMPPAYSTVTGDSTETKSATTTAAPVAEQQNLICVNETIATENKTEAIKTAESVKEENKQ